jgi:hypothetical protein
MTALSQRLNGVGLINLIKCGSKPLNATLQKSMLELYFDVNHYGLLNIPQVLASLADLFPLARSHTFIDVGNKGCQGQFNIASITVDLSLLERTHLNVTSFSFVGSGAFVRMMNHCLAKVEHKLDDIFPVVVNWNAGKFNDMLPVGKPFPTDYELLEQFNQLNPTRVAKVESVVPLSARRVRVSSPTNKFHLNPRRQPLETLALTDTSISLKVLAFTSSFHSLTALSIPCDYAINARDLPRNLTAFTACKKNVLQSVNNWVPFTLSDPPPGLKHLHLASAINRLVLPKDEFVPLACLKTLNVRCAIDPSHRLSASCLPPRLSTLSIEELTADLEVTMFVKLDEHLFANLHTDTWVKSWPPKLCIDRQGTTVMSTLIERLVPFAHLDSCLFTLQCALGMVDTGELSSELQQLTQQLSQPYDDVDIVLDDASLDVDGVRLEDENLPILYDALQPGKSIPSTQIAPLVTAMTMNSKSATDEVRSQKEFVLHNLHRICPSISTLKYLNYLDELPVFPFIRDLTIDRFPEKALNMVVPANEKTNGERYVSSDSIESLTIMTEPMIVRMMQRNEPTLHGTCRFINNQIPQFLFQLPSRLVTLDIQFASWEADILAVHLRKWLGLLPKTLHYLHLKRCYTERAIEFVPEAGDAALLPPELRLMNWTAFHTSHNHAGAFCKQVALIPSLHRLVLVMSDLGGPLRQHQNDTTVHCHSFAKTFIRDTDSHSLVGALKAHRRKEKQMICCGLVIIGVALTGVIAAPIVIFKLLWRYFG